MNTEKKHACSKRIGRIAAGLFSVALLASCQGNPARDADPMAEMDRAIREGIASQPRDISPPPEVSAALMPALTASSPVAAAGPPEPRFDITVSNAPARDFFMGLVEGTPYNMVVHPQVSGSISLNLKDVSIPEVMDVTRSVYGYEFSRETFGYQVLPARLRSRIFDVNYLNIQRSGSSQTRVSSGQISQAGRSSSTTEGSTSDSASVTGTEINTVQPDTTFWGELETSVRAIVGSQEGRSVVVNPQVGVVVVRAMPQELREVEGFLRAAQENVSRQVILEAKILEVELSDGFQTGINWAAVVGSASGRNATIGHVGGGSAFPDNLLGDSLSSTGTTGNAGNLNPNALTPPVGTTAAAFGGVFSLALNLTDVTAFIELLKTQGNVQVLSSPRIATLNNQKAVIKVGSDEFFVTDISSTTVTGTSTTTTPSVELTPFFSGIALDVTPQISRRNEVILHVHPSVSEVVDQDKQITVGSVSQTIPLALSTVRESDSIVRAQSGQMVVIGGLMRNRLSDAQAATPGLSELPLAGALFRHNRQAMVKTELVILLRPVVVDGSRQWIESLTGSGDTLQSMRRSLDLRTPPGTQ